MIFILVWQPFHTKTNVAYLCCKYYYPPTIRLSLILYHVFFLSCIHSVD